MATFVNTNPKAYIDAEIANAGGSLGAATYVNTNPKAYIDSAIVASSGTVSGTCSNTDARDYIDTLVATIPPDPSGAGEMLISNAEIAALPTSGSAWAYMKGKADDALNHLNLVDGSETSDSPWLPNYNGGTYLSRPATQTLAMALVYARTGTVAYKDKVIAACKYLIGTEDSTSTDGTALSDRLLATARQLPAWIMAADLVGMDPTEVGTRTSYTTTQWDDWLLTLRDKEISTATSGKAISSCNDQFGHNWAAFCSASRAAIDIYLGDTTDLDATYTNFKRYVGDRTAGGTLGSDIVSIGEFENSHTGWSANGFVTVTLTDNAHTMTFSHTDATTSRSSGFRSSTANGSRIACSADTNYQIRVPVNVTSLPTGGFTNVRYQFYDASNATIGSTVNLTANYNSGSINLVHNVTSPSGAASLWIGVYGNSGSTGGQLYSADVSYIRMHETSGQFYTNSSDFDPSFVCLPSGYDIPEADWVPINPSDCGDGKDGIIVEDLARSSVSYPSYEAEPGVTYMFEGFMGQLVAAILLDNAGKTVWTLQSNALKRVMGWLDREGYATGVSTYDVYRYPSFVVNHFYSASYPTYSDGAKQSRCFGYADWLYG